MRSAVLGLMLAAVGSPALATTKPRNQPPQVATSTLTVTVNDQSGNPLNAEVIAIFFNNGNPDQFASQIAVTTNGVATFEPQYNNALFQYDTYQIVATTQGYTPDIVTQFNNNPPSVTADPNNPANLTIILTATPNLGEIDAPVMNATPGPGVLLFGQVALQGGGGAVQYGVSPTDAGGSGLIRFYNIAYTGTNTNVFSVSAFDTLKNLSASTPVAPALNSGTPGILAGTLNFATAPPPVTTISQAQQSGQSGNLSVQGVMTDTTTAANPISYSQINFNGSYTDQYGQNHFDYRGAQTDQNGVFLLSGLLPGVTYYSSTFGGCVFNGPNSGSCYQGYQAGSGTPTPGRDIVAPATGTVVNLNVTLQGVAPSTGTLAVYVTDQFGNSFPQSGINLSPDGAPWQTGGGNACGGSTTSNPGLRQINLNNVTSGYALLTGLPSGNYNLSVFTPYGQAFANAPNNTGAGYFFQGCNTSGGPYYRLTIDTTTSPDMQFYDVYGNPVGGRVSSTTVVVQVSTGSTGVVQGTLTFPNAVNDLSQSPIVLSLNVQCNGGGNCPQGGGGFKVFNNPLTPQTTTYSIPVSSGYAYYLNVESSYWGPIFPGGNQPQPDLTLSTSAIVNLQMVQGGRILGYMRKPDGSVFTIPQNNTGGSPSINANGNNGGGYTQLNNDGSFVIGGVQPGVFTLQAQAGGYSPFPYTTVQPAPSVSVVANQDVHQDVNLVGAVSVRPVLSTTTLPYVPQYSCNQNGGGNCPPESVTVIAYPAGTPYTSSLVSGLLANNNGSNEFSYSASSGQANGNNCNGQYLTAAGFCTNALPANGTGTSYDFYVGRMGSFDSQNLGGGVRPYFVIEIASKSVAVGAQYVNDTQLNGYPPSQSTGTVEDVNLNPANSLATTPEAVLSGTVTVTNLITPREFQQLGGNFNNFIKYLPIAWVYDSTGNLKGAGLTVPFPPTEALFDTDLTTSVAANNYPNFHQLFSNYPPLGWGSVGYEIRGLTAGQAYTIVMTSPNYPPYKTSVTLGAAGSTTTLNINLDANQGSTLSGVVESTATNPNVPLVGAQVTVQSAGYPATTVTTDVNGTWSLPGLSAGQYQVQAVAAGYAQSLQNVPVDGVNPMTAPTFQLLLGNASISGTVYTNNPICPAGASCSAFGKTVLQGVTVEAYDDTINANTSTVLPLYKAVTDSSGVYTLGGLVYTDNISTSPHVYKIFVPVPGYYVLNQSTPTQAGPVTGFDFSLKPKPLSVNVFGYVAGANYEFQITNYQRFSNGQAYIGPTVGFSTGIGGTAASVNFVMRPDSQGNQELFLDYPLTSLTNGVSYTLEIIAQPNNPSAAPVVSVTNFGLGIPNNTCQAIDQSLVGDSAPNAQGVPANQAPLDISGGTGGNASGLSLPVGAVIPIASTSVPSMCMNQTAANVAPQSVAAIRSQQLTVDSFLSGVYNVTLSSINYVMGKGVNLTLSYNQATTDVNDAAIYTYDQTTQKWQSVPGLQTINTVQGTISVNGLQSLASVLNLKSVNAKSFMAQSNGRTFTPNASMLRPDDSGIFAILKPSQVSGGSFSGTIVKVYNFPNPFNLQTKTVPLNLTSGVCAGAGGPIVTDGTVIKYEIPSGISGTGVIRIYTLSGRLVREIDAGNVQPENCYYTTWDGRNRNGLPVANGVYYGILSVAGSKLSSGTFKLAVIK